MTTDDQTILHDGEVTTFRPRAEAEAEIGRTLPDVVLLPEEPDDDTDIGQMERDAQKNLFTCAVYAAVRVGFTEEEQDSLERSFELIYVFGLVRNGVSMDAAIGSLEREHEFHVRHDLTTNELSLSVEFTDGRGDIVMTVRERP